MRESVQRIRRRWTERTSKWSEMASCRFTSTAVFVAEETTSSYAKVHRARRGRDVPNLRILGVRTACRCAVLDRRAVYRPVASRGSPAVVIAPARCGHPQCCSQQHGRRRRPSFSAIRRFNSRTSRHTATKAARSLLTTTPKWMSTVTTSTVKSTDRMGQGQLVAGGRGPSGASPDRPARTRDRPSRSTRSRSRRRSRGRSPGAGRAAPVLGACAFQGLGFGVTRSRYRRWMDRTAPSIERAPLRIGRRPRSRPALPPANRKG